MKGWTAEELEEMRRADEEIERTFVVANKDERALSAELDRVAKRELLLQTSPVKAAKDCSRSLAYYYTHREERLAYKRKWRQANKAEISAYNRAWYQAHREARRAQMRDHAAMIRAYPELKRREDGDGV